MSWSFNFIGTVQAVREAVARVKPFSGTTDVHEFNAARDHVLTELDKTIDANRALKLAADAMTPGVRVECAGHTSGGGDGTNARVSQLKVIIEPVWLTL